jgi:ribose 5-phosphate isomerase A
MANDVCAELLARIPPGGVVGLGTGRAATAFVRRLADHVRAGHALQGVPTSEATAQLARTLGIPLTTLADAPELAVAFDGADEVDPAGNVIKGYGGALVREKIVACAARQFVVLVGAEKLVPTLGTRGKLPIEVIPFALPTVLRQLARLGMPGTARSTPSDNGNVVVDCQIGPLADPLATETALRRFPGLVDTGLFLNLTHTIVVQHADRAELRVMRGPDTGAP